MAWIIAVLLVYLVGMIAVGVVFFRKASSLSDYFIGGRRLGPLAAALSTYASDMSGWLMLGFVGIVYANGAAGIWIALGLALGSILNWLLVAKRLRRYSLISQYAITIPEYFENRFRDSSHTLRFVSSIFIILFFTLYTAAGFMACGTLFSQVFGIPYRAALLAGVLVILAYTSLGGFRAVCWTDLIQGLLVLAAVVAVPIVVLRLSGGFSGLTAGLSPAFLDPLQTVEGGPLPAVTIISGLAWGLGYFGMPHILIRFMAVRNERAMLPAACIAGASVAVSLGFMAIMGIAAAAINPDISEPSRIFILAIQKIFTGPGAAISAPLLGGLFFCGILAAIMSTADSQLILSASALTNDLYQGLVRRTGRDKFFLRISRISVVAVTLVAYIIARDQPSALKFMVSSAWAGFGSAFGALILLSLYWKRLSRGGAIAGVCAGGFMALFWDYVPLVPQNGKWLNLEDATGLYSLVPGFCVSLLCIVVFSLAAKPPSEEILNEFAIAAVKPIYEE
ncbi:MAG: sodium/proline symporter [Treponema sp.]|jgi:sodium/proline symporter|nr:sodium/proline symporter [Treponema sp.]